MLGRRTYTVSNTLMLRGLGRMITGGRVVVCSAAVSVADAVVKLLVSLLPPAYQPLVLYHVESQAAGGI